MIHPTSDVHSSRIGKNTLVWQFCVILKDAEIGEDCNINANVFIENDKLWGDIISCFDNELEKRRVELDAHLVKVYDTMREQDKSIVEEITSILR